MLLDELIASCDRYAAVGADRISIGGKSVEERGDASAMAAALAKGECTAQYPWGQLSVVWRYGPMAWGQRVYASINGRTTDINRIRKLFTELSVTGSADYAYADLDVVVQRESDSALADKCSLTPADSFYTLFWFNYFGAPYRGEIPVNVNENARQLLHDVLDVGAGVVVLLRESPLEKADAAKLERVFRAWPVFSKSSKASRFSKPIDLDYSEVRGIVSGVAYEAKKLELPVGDVEAFIGSAVSQASRFCAWLKQKGADLSSEDRLLEAIWRHAEELDADENLFRGACAAYGEMVRQRVGGYWAKGYVGGSEEPLIKKTWQPWREFYIVGEVVAALDTPTEDDL